ncbi:MAG: MazG nucleotide pyrophosphohydrolase domain-containing protein [Bernardetiaceae bacterium]
MTLHEKPTLPELQAYLKAVCAERGWDKNNDLELFLLFSEEVGELAKAIRNQRGLYAESGKITSDENLEEEFADVLSYLMDLANYFNIDLETAFRKKDAYNQGRTWKKQERP